MSEKEYQSISGAEYNKKRFNTATDEEERMRQIIAGDPFRLLHFNGN